MATSDEGSPSDQTLLHRFRRGDEDAATQLYVRYAERLLALAQTHVGTDLARRVDPEDIVQSVFRTFFRRAAKGEYEVPDGDELWKLFLVIGLNKIRATAAHHRAAKRSVGTTVGGDAIEHHSPASAESESLSILRLAIEEILSSLPADHSQIIALRIEGYEVAEIAAKVGRAKRSVERILQEFRKLLQRQLRVDDDRSEA